MTTRTPHRLPTVAPILAAGLGLLLAGTCLAGPPTAAGTPGKTPASSAASAPSRAASSVAGNAGAGPAAATGTSAPKAPRRPRPKLTVTVDADTTAVIDDTVARDKVEAVFARGPQFIAASIQVAPAFENKRFLGFRIVSFTRGSVFADSMGLRPGDIVMRVNNEPIERPEMFMRAWEVARQAPVIEVRVMREGEVIRHRWRVSP